ncbi:hypothetical protein B0H17DRAFT_933830, partial [Mycena rosella]
VTGASGFLGSHVVLPLLEKGCRVRAYVSIAGTDVGLTRNFNTMAIVLTSEIAHDKFPEALVGVDAVIHLASPLPGQLEPAALLATAIDGTLNTVVQAEKAGIKRIVVTSSIASVMNPQFSFTDQG